jgi:hypothetical protein
MVPGVGRSKIPGDGDVGSHHLSNASVARDHLVNLL